MNLTTKANKSEENSTVRGFFRDLGPGLITGAADDDPSGISTYSVAGATFRLRSALDRASLLPLMVSVQLMCARLGMVTGRGLASAIRQRYPRWVLWGACLLLIVANVINIGADLGGMAQATELVTGVHALLWTPVYAGIMLVLLFWSSYRRIARIFKWLTLVLFAYVATAFLAHTDWKAALEATLLPRVHWSREFLSLLVAILGTTISPYLFFWQAAEEVEEERAKGKNAEQRKGATEEELRKQRTDVMTGMFFSNFIMYFITSVRCFRNSSSVAPLRCSAFFPLRLSSSTSSAACRKLAMVVPKMATNSDRNSRDQCTRGSSVASSGFSIV